LAGGLGLALFAVLLLQLRLPEVDQLVEQLRRKFFK
jgi:hypothetical protein